MNGAGLFFLLLLLLVILPILGWVGFTQWRARKQGLPPPPLSSYNPFAKLFKGSGSGGGSGGGNFGRGGGGNGRVGWIKGKLSALQEHRAGQGYAGATRGARGFGPLDPDAAWDDRVALEADAVDDHPYGHGYGRGSGGMGGMGGSGSGSGGRGVGRSYAEAGYEEQELGGIGGAGASAMPAYGAERAGRGHGGGDDDGMYHGASLGAREMDARYEAAVHGGGSGMPVRALSPRPVDERGPKNDRRSIFREDV